MIALLTPMANLARYQIQQLNNQLAAQKKMDEATNTTNAAEEMEKESAAKLGEE